MKYLLILLCLILAGCDYPESQTNKDSNAASARCLHTGGMPVMGLIGRFSHCEYPPRASYFITEIAP